MTIFYSLNLAKKSARHNIGRGKPAHSHTTQEASQTVPIGAFSTTILNTNQLATSCNKDHYPCTNHSEAFNIPVSNFFWSLEVDEQEIPSSIDNWKMLTFVLTYTSSFENIFMRICSVFFFFFYKIPSKPN